MRAEADLRNEKINYKVREHSLAKVPLLLVVGKREAEEGTVALRRLGREERQQVLTRRRGDRDDRGGGDPAGPALTPRPPQAAAKANSHSARALSICRASA